MADDSYANKSHWRALLLKKVRISNESKGNGYIDNCLEVVCTEMLLRMKTAAHHSFLAQKPRERHRSASVDLGHSAAIHGSAALSSEFYGGYALNSRLNLSSEETGVNQLVLDIVETPD